MKGRLPLPGSVVCRGLDVGEIGVISPDNKIVEVTGSFWDRKGMLVVLCTDTQVSHTSSPTTVHITAVERDFAVCYIIIDTYPRLGPEESAASFNCSFNTCLRSLARICRTYELNNVTFSSDITDMMNDPVAAKIKLGEFATWVPRSTEVLYVIGVDDKLK